MVSAFRFSTMATGLAILGIVKAITIDNHLMPTITDCYERLAIGERLQQDNVYKSFNYNTVAECKRICTDERKSCKAFAFGISAKGNATCELSIDSIKETADLKPLGTVHATDFDLYIKKLDCTLVTNDPDKKGNPHHQNNDHRPTPKPPATLGDIPDGDEFHHDPLHIAPGVGKPPDRSPNPPDSSHRHPPPAPSHQYGSPPIADDVHHVHALVSIASGPQSVLNPLHGILVAQESSNYGGEGHLPPFKPAALKRPYNSHNTRPDRYDRPDPDYGNRPDFPEAGVEYADGGFQDQPYWPAGRPDLDRFDVSKPWSSSGYILDRYGDRPSSIPYRPEPDFSDSHRPLPNRYGSVIPHPDEYDLPTLQSDYLFQQSHHESFSEFYHNGNDRPARPSFGSHGYDGDDHDALPTQGYNDRYGNTDRDPDYASQIPLGSSPGYHDRNQNKDKDSHYSYGRPPRPLKDDPNDYSLSGPSRPGAPSQGYDDRNQNKDKDPHYSYGRPPRPLEDDPNDYSLSRPSRPGEPSQGYEDRNQNKDKDPHYSYGRPPRPLEDDPNDYSLSRPSRPGAPSQGYDDRNQNKDKDPHYSYGRPPRPSEDDPNDYSLSGPSRPGAPSQGYDDRNQNKDKDPHYSYGRPPRPLEDDPNDYSLSRPSRPGEPSQGYEDEKPVRPRPSQRPSDGYGEAGKPELGGSDQRLKPYGRPGGETGRPGTRPYGDEEPLRPTSRPSESYSTSGKLCCSIYGEKNGAKPIVSHSIGYNGEQITSIITELEDACYRRVLAGKRVSRDFVKRTSICETVEECQKECAEEKRFSCEGFNYRLDPSGRGGKGECQLIDQPLARLDLGRDLYPHPDYDYYERDRNAATANCDRRRGGGYYGPGGGAYADRRHDYGGSRRPPPIDYPPPPLRRPAERWPDDSRYSSRRPLRPEADYDRRRPSHGYDDYERRRLDYDYERGGNRRGDFSHHPQDHYHQTDGHYLPPRPIKPSTYEPYLPLGYYDYQRRKDRLDYTHTRNQYLPPSRGASKPWGLYDSAASADKHYSSKHTYNYWASDRYGSLNSNAIGGSHADEGGAYLPPPKPSVDRIGRPPSQSVGGGFVPVVAPHVGGGYSPVVDSASLPAEPRRTPTYNFIKDECSLRSATGFRLHKGIVKKFYAVPNIQECERLCFKEKDFPCSSYAFRYTLVLSAPTDNCYLSNRNYKELDYYTDLEPDKNFDIYTMNNKNRCEEPILHGRDTSDCFWRVRSGQRLDYKIVRDSLIAKSIVECQIECLKSNKFTCRAFSYRYGSPTIGGSIDNCQLTDWPFYELNPKVHFIPEVGFEVYERGSFGHGCEPDHFGIRGLHGSHKGGLSEADQLCYIGFGSPARLLPQATKKSLSVSSELKCKEECSKARAETLFQCMSFSFRTGGRQKNQPNCFLSDIYQRDLLPKLDYIYDPDFWLFAWDNYNPECVTLAREPLSTNHIGIGGGISHLDDRNDFSHALDTWRVYSVSGWPCRRGALCEENKEAGFWFCELEGGDKNTWDYCCRPDHRCGSSHGYPYQWCYVGPSRTQWRKCSDRYFPYIHNLIDRLDSVKPYLPPKLPWTPPVPFRPDRPPAPTRPPHAVPSLDQYEAAFDEEFLDPPKPGGFGQPRHWPVSYLHKEMPPNVTDSRLMRMETNNSKYTAIQNLIDVIRSNDLQNVQYHISNESNTQDDILFVKIPLPANFTQQAKTSPILSRNTSINLEPVDVKDQTSIQRKRSHKSLPASVGEWNRNGESMKSVESLVKFGDISRPSSQYRRAFITRTNVTMHDRQL